MGDSHCGSADSMRQQHRNVTASLDLNKREKQKGLWDVTVERARVVHQTALDSNPGPATYRLGDLGQAMWHSLSLGLPLL